MITTNDYNTTCTLICGSGITHWEWMSQYSWIFESCGPTTDLNGRVDTEKQLQYNICLVLPASTDSYSYVKVLITHSAKLQSSEQQQINLIWPNCHSKLIGPLKVDSTKGG